MDKDLQQQIEQMTEKLRAEFGQVAPRNKDGAPKPVETMVPMRDGVELATKVWEPQAARPYPTILMRSCYPHQEALLDIYGEEYSARGFAFVWQACRGTGRSQGAWLPNENERNDGLDTLAWMERQEAFGDIGYYGSSYLALTGWAMADALTPKVKTLYLSHYGTDRFTSAYQSGLFRQDVLTAWAMDNAGFPIGADYIESASYRPQLDVDVALWGKRLDWYRDWITSTNRSDAYWQGGFWKQLEAIPQKVDVPVCLVEGWYDHHLGSALKTWQALPDDTKAQSLLRIGAWNHGFAPCVTEMAPRQDTSETAFAFHWFRRHLMEKPPAAHSGVEYFSVGNDGWYTARSYPFASAATKALYFSPGGDGSGSHGLLDAPAPEAELGYRYDPNTPVPSHGAESLLVTMDEIGSLPQPPCGWREDVLSFLSEPFEQALDILGQIQVSLQVASDAEDTAFTAKVMEILPGGVTRNIRGSIATLAYRNGTDSDRITYRPGERVQLTLAMWDIAWCVQKGSRLRVDISSSDFPQYAVHSNYPGVWSEQAETKPANQTLYLGAVDGCRMILPIANKQQIKDGNYE